DGSVGRCRRARTARHTGQRLRLVAEAAAGQAAGQVVRGRAAGAGRAGAAAADPGGADAVRDVDFGAGKNVPSCCDPPGRAKSAAEDGTKRYRPPTAEDL